MEEHFEKRREEENGVRWGQDDDDDEAENEEKKWSIHLCASILQGYEMSLQHSKNRINKMDIR